MSNCPDICTAEIGDKNDEETVNLPKYEPEVDVSLAVDSGANTLKVFVAVDDSNDTATVDLPPLPVKVEADIDSGTIIVDVTVGDENDLGATLLERQRKWV